MNLLSVEIHNISFCVLLSQGQDASFVCATCLIDFQILFVSLIPYLLHTFNMAKDGGDEKISQRILRLTDTVEKPSNFLMPISGYERMPLVPLDEAVKPLVAILPTIESYTYAAKQRCKKPDENLTQDEQAAIMLYSMGWEPLDECLYYVLNASLRSTNRGELKPWFRYLRIFLGALFRLPAEPQRAVYRGVKLNLASQFEKDETVVWWGFTSCTTKIEVLQSESFLGKDGPRTMFTIDCFSARNISKYSYFPSEDEVLLLVASHFTVKGILDQGHGLHTIQLHETKPPVPLLFPVPLSSGVNDILMESSLKSGMHLRKNLCNKVVLSCFPKDDGHAATLSKSWLAISVEGTPQVVKSF